VEDYCYCGECIVCDESVELDDMGNCGECGGVFHWGSCGSWHPDKFEHCCNDCMPEES